MGHPTTASAAAEFVRLGFAGASLHFRVQVTGGLAEFTELAHVIGNFGPVTSDDVVSVVTQLTGNISCIEIGRENTPVIYLHVPWWSHHCLYAAERGATEGFPLTDGIRRLTAGRLAEAGRMLHADEVDIQTAFPGTPGETVSIVRWWWD